MYRTFVEFSYDIFFKKRPTEQIEQMNIRMVQIFSNTNSLYLEVNFWYDW